MKLGSHLAIIMPLASMCAFPLTPALSLREREDGSQRSNCWGVPVGRKRGASLPLPEGEGRGEGEEPRLGPISSGNFHSAV